MKKLNPCIFKSVSFFLALVFLVATSKLWFPLLNHNRVTVLSSTIILCIVYLIYDLIVNHPHIKENNNQIRTKTMDRSAGDLGMVNTVVREGPQGGQRGSEFGLRRRQAFGETERINNTYEFIQELRKLADKMKEEQKGSRITEEIVEEVCMRELARVHKENKDSVAMSVLNHVLKANKELILQKANRELVGKLEEVGKGKRIAVESKIKFMDAAKKVSCFDNVEKANKELVAKLEVAEKDKKIAVESKIKLMKILDEERKKVWCLDHVQKVNKELVAKLEKVEKDKKIAVESRIELMKILDEEKKKVSRLEKKCVDLEKGFEEVNKKMLSLIDLIENRKDGFGSIMKVFEKERDKCKMLSDLIECKRLEKAEGIEAHGVENKLETDIPVDENTYGFEDVMLESEDDIVYVDSDGFEEVENF
ncbi:uncharacterized protein LOC141646393 [Silene latifolia]|uniref:uncharacterized protein LOC141646393 n=1 Tax=Silene latifolia TaxID=37657 RepID=UPI003D772E29